MSALHYREYFYSQQKNEVACGRSVDILSATRAVELVDCKACLRTLAARGDKAWKRLCKISPGYARVKR